MGCGRSIRRFVVVQNFSGEARMEQKGKIRGRGVILCLSLVLACTPYPIAKQYRQQAAKNAAVADVQANPQLYEGKVVIWGGTIINLLNDSFGSELTIIESPLDEEGYPYPEPYSQGRFKAHLSSFLDPLIFRNGMKVTLAGTVAGLDKEKLGNGIYGYPMVQILQLRYWQNYHYYYPYYYYGPHHGWW